MMTRVLASLLLIVVATGTADAAEMPAKDMIPGAKDNPLLSRYTGSVIVAYLAKNYDDADLVAGKFKQQEEHVPPFEKILHVEGKITRIVYTYPKERSGLEVFRNYRAAIQSAGMTVLFSCEKATCDPSPDNFGTAMENYKINEENETWPKSGDYTEPFNYGRTEPRYILASHTRADGAVTYAAVYVVAPQNDENGGVLVEIVEPAAMETGKVSVNLSADAMAKAIDTDGKVALYGLYFDTDRTELRADSKPSLDEIAKLLRQNPKLNVYVVGHTDNQGVFAHNLELSQKRSESVVRSLTVDYKIGADRLTAKAAASIAPVATNDTEAGRARNRRVELVKQ
jgi:outer membrane protein OmpA-like peptidoglycan-associated protein